MIVNFSTCLARINDEQQISNTFLQYTVVFAKSNTIYLNNKALVVPNWLFITEN